MHALIMYAAYKYANHKYKHSQLLCIYDCVYLHIIVVRFKIMYLRLCKFSSVA